jgi:hypothetical protein
MDLLYDRLKLNFRHHHRLRRKKRVLPIIKKKIIKKDQMMNFHKNKNFSNLNSKRKREKKRR